MKSILFINLLLLIVISCQGMDKEPVEAKGSNTSWNVDRIRAKIALLNLSRQNSEKEIVIADIDEIQMVDMLRITVDYFIYLAYQDNQYLLFKVNKQAQIDQSFGQAQIDNTSERTDSDNYRSINKGLIRFNDARDPSFILKRSLQKDNENTFSVTFQENEQVWRTRFFTLHGSYKGLLTPIGAEQYEYAGPPIN